MKKFLMLAALAGGFLLIPQLANAHDWSGGSFGSSNAGSRGGVYSRSYNQPCNTPSRVPNYGANVYGRQFDSYGGFNSGYSRSRYTPSYGVGRFNNQFNGPGCRAW